MRPLDRLQAVVVHQERGARPWQPVIPVGGAAGPSAQPVTVLPPAPRRRTERGIALILVTAILVFLSSFVLEISSSAQARFIMASNARNDAQARYLAISGYNIEILVLSISRGLGRQLGPLFEQLGLGQVDQFLHRFMPPLDSAMLRFMAVDTTDDPEDEIAAIRSGQRPDVQLSAEQRNESRGEDWELGPKSLLDFEGDFRVELSEEHGKINLNTLFQLGNAAPLRERPTALELYGLISSPAYDRMFEERIQMDRWEVIGNIADWIDPDSEGEYGSDENGRYRNYEPRYEPKNAPFDSLQELKLVDGVTDEFYETFSPFLTVHSNRRVDVNVAELTTIVALIRAFSEPSTPEEQVLAAGLQAQQRQTLAPFRSAAQFTRWVEEQGIPITDRSGFRRAVGTDSDYFRIVSTGYVGNSARQLEVIIHLRRVPHRVLYWRED